MLSKLKKMMRRYFSSEESSEESILERSDVKNLYEIDVRDRLEPGDFTSLNTINFNPSPDKFSPVIDDKGINRHDGGKVTQLTSFYGLINNELFFYVDALPKTSYIQTGDIVSYLTYQAKPNEAVRVIKVWKPESDTLWIDDVISAERFETKENMKPEQPVNGSGSRSLEEAILNGKISRASGTKIWFFSFNDNCDKKEISCDLKEVNCDFIPVVGDLVSVTMCIEHNPQPLYSSRNFLHIKKITPVLKKNGFGAITYVNTSSKDVHGCIENTVLFSESYCPIDFKPTLGEKVEYMAIESDQGKYKWRALSLHHTRSDKEKNLKNEKNDCIKDIEIIGDTKIGPIEIEETREVTLEVKNKGHKSQVIDNFKFLNERSKSQLKLLSPKLGDKILIEPLGSVRFIFECKAKILGLSSEEFVFCFKSFKIVKSFKIEITIGKNLIKLLERETGDPNTIQDNLTYKNFDISDALFGKNIVSKSRFERKIKIGNYPIPKQLFQIILGETENSDNTRSSIKKELEIYAPYLRNKLTADQYRERFHLLLFMEEITDQISFKRYDQNGVVLTKKDQFLSVNVENIKDVNSTFKVGYSVILTQPWSEINTRKQVGYIHKICDEELFVSFHESFHASYDESECDISFQPSRLAYLRAHAAIDRAMVNLGKSWLFPDTTLCTGRRKEPEDLYLPNCKPLNLYDFVCKDDTGHKIPSKSVQAYSELEKHKIVWVNNSLNDLQRMAVKNILKGSSKPLPYIIFGPPGTGKTKTIVEAILQIYFNFPDSRIVITAPTNSAADVISHNLIEFGKLKPGEIIRIVSLSRASSGNIPENIIPYTIAVYDDVITCLTIESNPQNISFCRASDCLGNHRIVVGTCTALGVFHYSKLPKNHFTHIFVDEACQATEPEALIVISFLDTVKGQVVLSGDTEQLGPVCRNVMAGQYGLSQSFMERISLSSPYNRNEGLFPETNGYDPRFITRLRLNYRSVPDILELPSKLFYNSELIPTISQKEGIEADIIKKLDFNCEDSNTPSAIIFHGVVGKNQRDENSFSWYNTCELWLVVCYLKKLWSINVKTEDIGIITPYQKQVEKLRLLLSELSLPTPKIGSVEEFQGQEKLAIILTTVRSTHCDNSEKALGFVASPRRLNVAITRARAILIIIGNPFTLSLDPYWSSVIKYITCRGAYTGCALKKCVPKRKARSDKKLNTEEN